jgi:pyruvate-formate lyase-activating enzyme
MVNTRTRLAILEARLAAVPGMPFGLDLATGEDPQRLRTWCATQDIDIVSVTPAGNRDRCELIVGAGANALGELPPEKRPGARLWMYTNFNCNLACTYCCASSSPRAPKRTLPLATIKRLAREAPTVGARDIFLTGGEPFLRADIDRVIAACIAAAPTTVLTNGMCFEGRRQKLLDECPRTGCTLQISLDSADPELHDRQRGLGSHARTLAGIALAKQLGFRVKIAATIALHERDGVATLHRLCDDLEIGPTDRLIRPIAQQGQAATGVTVSRRSLLPEICVTDNGIWWHPVAVTDPAMQVCAGIPPLRDVIVQVTAEIEKYRRDANDLVSTFPCA